MVLSAVDKQPKIDNCHFKMQQCNLACRVWVVVISLNLTQSDIEVNFLKRAEKTDNSLE